MAKRSSPKTNVTAGRGISNITTSYAARPLASPSVILTTTNTYPDARTYRPDRYSAPPIAKNVNATRLVARDTFGDAIRRQTKARIAFKVPKHVALCVRRKQRKQVLHAKKKTGAGVSRKKPTRNMWSQISCKG